MIDWEQLLSRPHLECAITGQPITPGTTFYSLLRWQDGRFQRADIIAEAWNDDLAAGSISWWRQDRAQVQEERGPRLLSPEILYTIFTDCARSTERPRQCLAWLLAWLLVRGRHLRYHDLINDGDHSYLVVQRRGSNQPLMRVRDPHMDSAEEALIQDQLNDLFADPNSPAGPPAAGE